MIGASQLKAIQIRPARASDAAFVATLYRTTRDDLRLIDADEEMIEGLIDMQHSAQTSGYGDMFPNAMHFIVERLGEKIGRLIVDFGSNEVRLIDVAFVPQARGKGYGTEILQMLQQAAAKIMAPLALSVHSSNIGAKQLYLRMGFRVEASSPPIERMVWYPSISM